MIDKLTIEEVKEKSNSYAAFFNGSNVWLKQLADTMRENERLRNALEAIRTSKHPMAIEIEHICEDALSNKEIVNCKT